MTSPTTAPPQPLPPPEPIAKRASVMPPVAVILVLLVIITVVLSRPLWQPWLADVVEGRPEPVVYVSKAYGFTATYPDDPTVESTTETSLGITVEATSFTVERSGDSFAVSVVDTTAFEIPDPGALSSADLDALLKASLDGAVGNIEGGVLLNHRFDDLGASRAVIADIDTAEGAGTLAIVIADDEYYIILAAGSDEDATRFIDSFELV